MKWKRICSDHPQVCSARGCEIPPGEPHWRKSWTTAETRQRTHSVYCCSCGDASRCSTGIVLLGPIGILILLLGCFGILPQVWPGHTLGYFGVFAVTFLLTAMISARSFFCIFSRCRQVQYHAPLLPEERRQLRQNRLAAA